jgi:hypothetical protein
MKRAIVVFAALTLGVVAYAGAAVGAGTSTSQHGRIRVAVGKHCDIAFALNGFARGTPGRLELTSKDKTVVLDFRVKSDPWTYIVRVHDLFDGPHTDEAVSYRIAVDGMHGMVSGTVTVHCNCGEEEGGGGGGNNGGGNNGGGNESGGVPTAGTATAVTSQPGFAG